MRFSKEWENHTVEISRKEMAEIVCEEIEAATAAAKATMDKDMVDFVRELLVSFSAGICAEMFPEDDLEVEK